MNKKEKRGASCHEFNYNKNNLLNSKCSNSHPGLNSINLFSKPKRSNSHPGLNSINLFSKPKRSQVTIFIIIAILIVAIVLILLFYPKIKTFVAGEPPTEYLKTCTEKSAEEAIKKISIQGGDLDPGKHIMYDGNKVSYLCYTNEYYKKCLMQKPFLKKHIQQEINDYVEPRVKACLESVKDEIEARGGSLNAKDTEIKTSIVPNSIIVTVNSPMTLVEGETRTSVNEFNVDIDSNMYDLISISSSIANWEARYGDSDPLTYMLYYPNVKIEKKKLSEGSTVYVLKHRLSEDKLVFASRSIALPSGYFEDRIE
jgi:hypothetical protein